MVVSQIENSNKKDVENRDMPLITYTVEVMDATLSKILYTESCDSFKEAIYAGENLRKNINKLKEKRVGTPTRFFITSMFFCKYYG